MPEQQIIQHCPAECYYVQAVEDWGWFTIALEVGILQIHSAFGSFAHRWNAPGPDFKKFLIDSDNVEDKLAYVAEIYGGMSERHARTRLVKVMQRLWPLFIEQLKAEREQAKETV